MHTSPTPAVTGGSGAIAYNDLCLNFKISHSKGHTMKKMIVWNKAFWTTNYEKIVTQEELDDTQSIFYRMQADKPFLKFYEEFLESTFGYCTPTHPVSGLAMYYRHTSTMIMDVVNEMMKRGWEHKMNVNSMMVNRKMFDNPNSKVEFMLAEGAIVAFLK